MNITLQLDGMTLKLEQLGQEEGLDALALLINSGVIPADEGLIDELQDELDEEEDGQVVWNPFSFLAEEPCGDTCGCLEEEEEDEELSPEDVFVGVLEALAETLEAAVKEHEEEQAKQKEEEVPAEIKELFDAFFGGLGKK